MSNVLYLIITIVFLCLSFVYAKNAIHVFQQNRYEFKRYSEWLFSLNNLHFSKTLIFVFLMLINFVLPMSLRMAFVLTSSIIFSIIIILDEEHIQYVKPLVLTDRVKRQIFIYVLLAFVFTFILVKIFIDNLQIVAILSIYLPYFLIYLLGIITLPLENQVKKKFEDDAPF